MATIFYRIVKKQILQKWCLNVNEVRERAVWTFGRRAFPNRESNRHEGQRREDASKASGTARRPLWIENCEREWPNSTKTAFFFTLVTYSLHTRQCLAHSTHYLLHPHLYATRPSNLSVGKGSWVSLISVGTLFVWPSHRHALLDWKLLMAWDPCLD